MPPFDPSRPDARHHASGKTSDAGSRRWRSVAGNVGRAVGLVRWTVAVMFGIAPGLTVGMIVVSVIEGLTPPVLFLAIRGVIDAQMTSRIDPAAAELGWWLGILFAAAAMEAFVTTASKLLRNLLLARANRDLTAAVLEQAARLPVGAFEERRSLDTLDRLRSQVAVRLVDLISRIAQVLTAGIQIVTILAALVRIEPLIAIVAPPCFLPYLWYQLSLGSSGFKEQHGPTGNRRWIGYSVNLHTSARNAAEVRLLGIAPHLVERFQVVMNQTVRRDVVFQETGRYAASVADNIAYGDWPRLRDERRAVARYAEWVGLAPTIERMPDGYDTVLDRQFGAYEPSGGIWQRIAVARSFAREAPLLILDEPTANVDARAEYELFNQFVELSAGRTDDDPDFTPFLDGLDGQPHSRDGGWTDHPTGKSRRPPRSERPVRTTLPLPPAEDAWQLSL